MKRNLITLTISCLALICIFSFSAQAAVWDASDPCPLGGHDANGDSTGGGGGGGYGLDYSGYSGPLTSQGGREAAGQGLHVSGSGTGSDPYTVSGNSLGGSPSLGGNFSPDNGSITGPLGGLSETPPTAIPGGLQAPTTPNGGWSTGGQPQPLAPGAPTGTIPGASTGNGVTGNYLDTTFSHFITGQGPSNTPLTATLNGQVVGTAMTDNAGNFALSTGPTNQLGVGNIIITDPTGNIVGTAAQTNNPTDGAAPYIHADTNFGRMSDWGTFGNMLDPNNQYTVNGATYANSFTDQVEVIQCSQMGNVFPGGNPMQSFGDYRMWEHKNVSIDDYNNGYPIFCMGTRGVYTTTPSGENIYGTSNMAFPFVNQGVGDPKTFDYVWNGYLPHTDTKYSDIFPPTFVPWDQYLAIQASGGIE